MSMYMILLCTLCGGWHEKPEAERKRERENGKRIVRSWVCVCMRVDLMLILWTSNVNRKLDNNWIVRNEMRVTELSAPEPATYMRIWGTAFVCVQHTETKILYAEQMDVFFLSIDSENCQKKTATLELKDIRNNNYIDAKWSRRRRMRFKS